MIMYGLIVNYPASDLLCGAKEASINSPSLITDLVIENGGIEYFAPLLLQPTNNREVTVSATEDEICLVVRKDERTKIAELKYVKKIGIKKPVLSLTYNWYNEWRERVINCTVSDSPSEKVEKLKKQFGVRLLTNIALQDMLGMQESTGCVFLCEYTNRLIFAYLKRVSMAYRYAETNIALSDSAIMNMKSCSFQKGKLVIETGLEHIEIEINICYDSCSMKIEPTAP